MSYLIQKPSKTRRADFYKRLLMRVIFCSAIFLFFIPKVGQDFQKVSVLPTPIVEVSIESAPKEVPIIAPVALKVAQESPEAHLKISKIGVNAVIKEMGITPEGAMAVPDNNIDVGWYSLGTHPGEVGSAVIGGHNRFDSEAGVFDRLDQLEKGDIVSVIDKNGIPTSFVVRDIRTYDAADEDSGIFESESGIHLNLITCSGLWDPLTKSSAQRLVIFTDIIEPTAGIAMNAISF